MARFLFVIPPIPGHTVGPTAVAQALKKCGHPVAWVSHEWRHSRLLASDAQVYGAPTPFDAVEEATRLAELESARGPEAYKVLTERLLVPIAREMVPAVEDAIEAFQPDVVVVEQHAWAGWLAARIHEVPWATVSGSFGDRRLALRDVPKAVQWTDQWMAKLQEEWDLEVVPEAENSPQLSMFFTSSAFLGDKVAFPPNYKFVGPAIGRPEDATEFPWSALTSRPRVLVTLGSINPSRGGRFYDAVGRALGDLPIQVVVVSPERFGPFPENFIARSWIPQLKVMEEVDAIISHGGPNTVNEALWYGLPQVAAPIKDDQPYTAHCLVNAGAGLRVSFPRPRPEAIREAVERILEESSFRRTAERLRASFPPAGGGTRAAELLVQMADGTLREAIPEPAARMGPNGESQA